MMVMMVVDRIPVSSTKWFPVNTTTYHPTQPPNSSSAILSTTSRSPPIPTHPIVFRAPASSLECCCFISNDEFLSGSDDGSVELWNMVRKKPVCIVKNAHPLLAPHKEVEQKDGDRIPNGHIENGNHTSESFDCSSTNSWISSVTVCRGSDLAASGPGNGSIRLWAIESESRVLQLLHNIPLVGFVNSLAFAKSGRFLVAGVGKECSTLRLLVKESLRLRSLGKVGEESNQTI